MHQTFVRRVSALAPRLAPGLALFMITGCGQNPGATPPADAGAPVVYTTFYPTTYFTERIVQGSVPVTCPLPDDEDPIFWRPDVEVIGAYQQATVIVINGASFERWVAMTSLPESRIVDTAAGFAPGELATFDTVTHSHGPAGDHTHDGVDGHFWLDPLLAKRQTQAIEEGLARALPQHATMFKAGRTALDADLETLAARLAALAPRLQGVRVFCSHPAYNYLARRHGWKVTNLDLDPAQEPTDAQWNEIAALAGEHAGPAIMLWESAPLPSTMARLEDQHGIASVLFSTAETLDAARRTAGADYLSIMNENIDRLEAALPRGTG